MKKVFALTILGLFLIAGNALAYTAASEVLPGHAGYDWVDIPYWTTTDLTTNVAGSNLYQLQIEDASFESAFGLFTVDDISNPTTIINTFEIFSPSDEPSFDFTSVFFRENSGIWQVSKDAYAEDDEWEDFDSNFGFYYAVAGDEDYTFYSDASFNTEDAEIQHIGMEYDGIHNLYLYLEDLPAADADWDWQDMTVFANDLEPVPEPGTVLLLGVGLLGVIGLARKRIKK